MATEHQTGATAVFEDGTSQTWVAAEGVKLSSEAVAEFLRICLKPEPASVTPLPQTEIHEA